MKIDTSRQVRDRVLKVVALGFGVWLCCLGTAARAQLEGWQYRVYRVEGGQPTAVLVRAATDEPLVLRAGDALEDYEVLTVNADRVVLRQGERLATLKRKAGAVASKGLNYRVKQMRAERTPVKQLLERLCRDSGLELVFLGEADAEISVDFSNMSVREILDSLCRSSALSYKMTDGVLWVVPESDLKRMIRL